ncbi:hypothetical protein L6164_025082 [Bauhinia variegata]|uniref:Uncharacterized protein n=1 Tax=Bauhinia variegata TaxID=167791 RepID=A0ACB9M212_BAUVA|nr:hypothetical protein L6164_025082 [Bauhinia variegata]
MDPDLLQSLHDLVVVQQGCAVTGYPDQQFIQLKGLFDDANTNFVEEIVILSYRDSSRLVSSIEQTL